MTDPKPTQPRAAELRLAEATRALEQDGDRPLDEPAATAAARSAPGDLGGKIIVRAGGLSSAPMLRIAVGEVGRGIGIGIMIVLVLGAIAGGGAARAALGTQNGDDPANFYVVLLAVLLVQSVLLLLWLVLMVIRPGGGSAVGWLGELAVRIGGWLAMKINRSARHRAAMTGIMRTDLSTPVNRWTLSAISHGVWLTFNIGALLVIVILLSTRQYTFVWETTILDERAYVPLTRAIAWLPERAGFETPTVEDIRGSQRVEDESRIEPARTAWSYLLVGSIVLYGFAPRLLLLALCLGRRRGLLNRQVLDVSKPGFSRLRPLLMPAAVSTGVVDDAPEVRDHSGDTHRVNENRAAIGEPAILGFELGGSTYSLSFGGPPRVHGVRWQDLGMVSSGLDQQRVRSDLAHMSDLPRFVVVVADLTNTPDRGAVRFLRELQDASGGRVRLVLTGGQALRERAAGRDDVDLRIKDWRVIAAEAGIDAAVELDLVHYTDVSAQRLRAVALGEEMGETVDGANAAAHGSRIAEAFDLIVNHAARWGSGAPDAKARAALHRDVAAVYGGGAGDWRGMFDLEHVTVSDLPGRLGDASRRMIDVLPGRLKQSPRWLAAGAMAGALGCVAAATLATPVVIGALPIWAGLGAAVSGAIQLSGGSKDAPAASDEQDDDDLRAAVDAAVLFAMVLDLQGDGEAGIAGVLDETLIEADGQAGLRTASDVRGELDELHHRYDIARARLRGGDA